MTDLQRIHVVVDRGVLESGNVWAAVDPVWWSANIYDGTEAYERSLERWSRPQRMLFAMCWYEAEVNNGGHDQFYFNSTGIVWRDALAGLDAVGIPEIAAIIEESARRLGGDPPLDRDIRQGLLEKLEPDFSDLDGAFYATASLDLSPRFARYMLENEADFLFEGYVMKPRP